jgi:hypothetical protein
VSDLLQLALDDMVPVFAGEIPDWPDVLSRSRSSRRDGAATRPLIHHRVLIAMPNVPRFARRSHRRFIAALVVGGALVLAVASVALGFAIHTWFAGEPAPPPVTRQIEQQNQLPANGRSFVRPKIDSSRARGVAMIDTPDGPVHLWVVPTVNAGGLVCWFIDFARDENPAAGRPAAGGGTCEQRPAPRSGFQWAYGWSEGHAAVNVLVGRVYVPAVDVIVKLSSGKQMTLPVTEHFFLGTFSRSDSLVSLTAVGHGGSVAATDKVSLRQPTLP